MVGGAIVAPSWRWRLEKLKPMHITQENHLRTLDAKVVICSSDSWGGRLQKLEHEIQTHEVLS